MINHSKALGLAFLAVLAIGFGATASAAQASEFFSANYNATLTGTQTANHTFKTKAGTVTCTSVSMTGTLTKQSPELVVKPSFPSCLLEGHETIVTTNGCEFKLLAGLESKPNESLGGMFFVCPVKKEIEMETEATGCLIKIPASKAEVGLNIYKTTPAPEDFDAEISAEFEYSVNARCGIVEKTYTGGIYTGPTTVKGNNGRVGLK